VPIQQYFYLRGVSPVLAPELFCATGLEWRDCRNILLVKTWQTSLINRTYVKVHSPPLSPDALTIKE